MKPPLLIITFFSLIFSSTAQTWQQLTLPTTNDIVSSSFVSDTEGWIGYKSAPSTATLYHTTDEGANWIPVSVPGSSTGASYVCFVSSLKGFVVVAGKAYKTVNGGSTWTQISLPGEPIYEPFFLNENTGFIAGTGEVFKTIDGGINWIAYPIQFETVKLWDMHFLDEANGFASEYNGYLFFTTNGGENWQISSIGDLFDYFFSVFYHPDGYLTYTGYVDDSGFDDYSSFIGGTSSSTYLHSYSSGVIGKLYDLKWFDSNRGYAAGADGQLVITGDGGQTWYESNLCEEFNLTPKSLLALDGFETIYVFGEGGRGFKNSGQCLIYSHFNYAINELQVQFSDQTANATSWNWDFGDGTTSTLQNPVHAYPSDGLYHACLTASNTCGEGFVECHDILICTSNTSQNAAGSLDFTFSEDGIASVEFDGSYSECRSLAIQPDHKVIGANFGYGSEIIRYQTNGQPDSTFSGDGIAELYENYIGSQVKLNSSGQVLVACRKDQDGFTVSVACFNPDGTLSSSFGNNGIASIDPAGASWETFRGMEVLPDDKILLLTSFSHSGNYYVQITRLKPDGSIDSSFAFNGVTKLESKSFTFHDTYPGGFSVAPDGKIIVAGKINNPLNKIAVARLHADGTMDSTFDGDGFAEADLSSSDYSDYASDVTVQPDGKILVAGSSMEGVTYRLMAILRYNIDGSLDNTFGTNGILELEPGNNEAIAKGVALQPDGKILVCGLTFFNTSPTKMLLVKLNADGSYDTSFGNNGFVQTSLDCQFMECFDVALDEDKIYLGGGDHPFNIVRYNNEICTAPTSLSANNITSSSAKLTWNEVSVDDRYKVRYKVVGTSAWTNISTANNFKKISSLTPETKYVWQVKSICGDDPIVSSDWSVKQFFTTKSLKSAGEISVITLEVYPNPFTSATTIEFSLPNASSVKIDLIDLLGRKIKTIATGNFEAGNHELNFSAEELSAGIYLLRLSEIIPSQKNHLGIITKKLIVE